MASPVHDVCTLRKSLCDRKVEGDADGNLAQKSDIERTRLTNYFINNQLASRGGLTNTCALGLSPAVCLCAFAVSRSLREYFAAVLRGKIFPSNSSVTVDINNHWITPGSIEDSRKSFEEGHTSNVAVRDKGVQAAKQPAESVSKRISICSSHGLGRVGSSSSSSNGGFTVDKDNNELRTCCASFGRKTRKLEKTNSTNT